MISLVRTLRDLLKHIALKNNFLRVQSLNSLGHR